MEAKAWRCFCSVAKQCDIKLTRISSASTVGKTTLSCTGRFVFIFPYTGSLTSLTPVLSGVLIHLISSSGSIISEISWSLVFHCISDHLIVLSYWSSLSQSLPNQPHQNQLSSSTPASVWASRWDLFLLLKNAALHSHNFITSKSQRLCEIPSISSIRIHVIFILLFFFLLNEITTSRELYFFLKFQTVWCEVANRHNTDPIVQMNVWASITAD